MRATSSMVSFTRLKKTLGEHGSNIAEEEKANIETALKEAKEAVKSDDVNTINTAVENLTKRSHKLAEFIYQQAAQQQQAAGAEPSEPQPDPEADDSSKTTSEKDDDDVIDAEVVDD